MTEPNTLDSESNSMSEQSDISNDKENENKSADNSMPSYLSYLRIFAGLNLAIGALAFVGFLCKFTQAIMGDAKESAGFGWLIALAVMLEGLLAYGLLNAIADIAENMIDVGNYVRDLKRKDRG